MPEKELSSNALDLGAQVVDASGLICPEPVMMLHSAVRDASVGDVIKVIATDPSTQKDIKQFCVFLGHDLLSQSEEDGVHVHYVKKGAGR